jgi:hypothetical protein
MYINASVEIEDGKGENWGLDVDSNGDVDITAPCGDKITIKAGRKGKFFSDFVKAYKKTANAVGIFDSTKEEVSKETNKNRIMKNNWHCTDCDEEVLSDNWCNSCGLCTDCCIE